MSTSSISPARTQSQTIGCLQLEFVTDPTIPQVTISGELVKTIVLSRNQTTGNVYGGYMIGTHESTSADFTFDADTLVLSYNEKSDDGLGPTFSSGSFQL